jgi:hypothetical protein
VIASGALSEHGVHLGSLLGPALLLAFWAGWADLRAWMHRQGTDLAPTAVLVAATASAGAGLVHALVMQAHLSEDVLYGGFFAAAAVAQLGWAVAVVRRPSTRLLLAGVAGNLLALSLWAQTRLVGIPLGVAAGRREPIGAMDLSCALLEAGVVVLCAWTVRARRSPVVRLTARVTG